jgi:hypothetical protein
MPVRLITRSVAFIRARLSQVMHRLSSMERQATMTPIKATSSQRQRCLEAASCMPSLRSCRSSSVS